ncbi:MAG TPA: hypothetical protein EYQ64_06890, partial [Gemmatimonadetes bacterium]|nr:hypothetical protein [Gemmatimonadota bacterium]
MSSAGLMVATMCAEFQAVEDLKHMNYCTFLTVLITVAVPASAIAQTASNVEKVVEVGASPHLRSEIKDDFKVEEDFTFVEVAEKVNEDNFDKDLNDPINLPIVRKKKKKLNCDKCNKAFALSGNL